MPEWARRQPSRAGGCLRNSAAICRLLFVLHGIFSAATSSAEAQPIITAQPKNVAVQLGQDAQFGVTASGVGLSYQWRLNGQELTDATNRNLTVTNVSLAGLGQPYDVVVSNSAGMTTSDPAWILLATRWTNLVYFGASEGLQRCDGPAWTDLLGNRLGVPLTNYYTGRSVNSSADVRSQIDSFLASYVPTTNTLISLWTGGWVMDYINGASFDQTVTNRLANLRLLAEAGAREFLLPRIWPPELTPVLARIPGLTNPAVEELDSLLDERLTVLEAEYGLTIYRPDVFALFKAIWDHPAAYGFAVPSEGSTTLGVDVFCDGVHMTTTAHRLVILECYGSLTPALRMEPPVPTPDGDWAISWSGGSPPFRVEHTTELSPARWEQIGDVGWSPAVRDKNQAAREFFRVVFLGQ